MKNFFRILLLAVSLFATPALLAEVVNINKATAAALQENLHGIGEKKAQAIVAYRKEFGAFKTLDEIMEVNGIGKGIFAKIKANISLSKGITALVGEKSDQPAAVRPVSKAVKKPAATQSTDKKVKTKAVEKKKKVKQDAKTKQDKVKKS